MTYAFGWSLQKALMSALRANPAVAAIVGDRVHDAAPPGAGRPGAAYVLLGDEKTAPWSTASDAGAAHDVSISAVTSEPGFATAKALAAAVSEAVLGVGGLERGRVVDVRFLGARTRRSRSDEGRRVDMRFRVVIEDTV
jgi:hypothetical protein